MLSKVVAESLSWIATLENRGVRVYSAVVSDTAVLWVHDADWYQVVELAFAANGSARYADGTATITVGRVVICCHDSERSRMPFGISVLGLA